MMVEAGERNLGDPAANWTLPPSGFAHFRANRAPLPLANCLASGNAYGGAPIPVAA